MEETVGGLVRVVVIHQKVLHHVALKVADKMPHVLQQSASSSRVWGERGAIRKKFINLFQGKLQKKFGAEVSQ